MSANVKSDPHPFRHLLALGLIAVGVIPLPLRAAAACDSAIPLVAGETWRDPGSSAGETTCFSVGLEAPGTLVLEVSVPADAPRAILTYVGPDPIETTVPRLLHRSATHLVLTGDPGSHASPLDPPGEAYLVRVEAEDPRQPLPPFRLSVRSVADRFVGSIVKSETDGELEIEPDPLWAAPPIAEPVPAHRHDLAALLAFLAPRLPELCEQGETDDHGDVLLCATALPWSGVVHGEIGNQWGDDVDVFRFHLATLTTVEIRAAGEIELATELYDRHGQRLDFGGARRVRTLMPGTYFVRVEGLGDGAGRYSLSVTSPGPQP
jgi:hypothetical protein